MHPVSLSPFTLLPFDFSSGITCHVPGFPYVLLRVRVTYSEYST